MKHRLETTPGLDIRQGEIVRLERLASGEWLLTTRLEVQYTAKAVILATGTFLKGKIFVGDVSYAVSYTHLDVYKRQPSGWPRPPPRGRATWTRS